MFRSLMTTIKELYLYLIKGIFMLQRSVKLRHYILGDVSGCSRAACMLCAVQNENLIMHCTQHTCRSATS